MWASSTGKARAADMVRAMQWVRQHPAAAAVLKAAAAIVLLGALFHYVDAGAIARSIRLARPEWIAAGVVLLIPQLWMQFIRWRFLLRASRLTPGNAQVFASLAAGFPAGFFTPGQLGEIGGRLYGLGAEHRLTVLAMAAIDRIYVLGMTIVLGLASALVYFPLYLPSAWGIGLTLLAALCCCIASMIMLMPGAAKALLHRLPARVRAHRFYAPLSVFETGFSTGHAASYTLQTLVLFGIIILQYHCFVNAFAPASLASTLLCVPIVLFVKSVVLPVSIGDLGVRESASVFFYLRMGVPAEAALNGSLCIFAVNVVLPAALGLIMLMRFNKRK